MLSRCDILWTLGAFQSLSIDSWKDMSANHLKQSWDSSRQRCTPSMNSMVRTRGEERSRRMAGTVTSPDTLDSGEARLAAHLAALSASISKSSSYAEWQSTVQPSAIISASGLPVLDHSHGPRIAGCTVKLSRCTGETDSEECSYMNVLSPCCD